MIKSISFQVMLCFLSSLAHAESSDVRQHATVPITLHADTPIIACDLWLYDALEGESISLDAWVPITNDTAKADPAGKGIMAGITMEVALCDPDCDVRLLRAAPNSSWWGGGNLLQQVHHWTYRASATYASPEHRQAMHFAAVVFSYSTRPKWVMNIDACQIRAVRNRP